MGTTPNGKRPQNNVTLSHSTSAKTLNPDTGKGVIAGPGAADAAQAKQPERSFAQPSPVSPAKPVTPKTHASEKEQADALTRNSTKAQKPAPVAPVKLEPKTEDETETEGK